MMIEIFLTTVINNERMIGRNTGRGTADRRHKGVFNPDKPTGWCMMEVVAISFAFARHLRERDSFCERIRNENW